jgi:hypothetical protein
VEYLLKVVRMALGNYGMPGGATSSQADISLFQQMKAYDSSNIGRDTTSCYLGP